VPGGVVHELPKDLREALLVNTVALDAWKDITPLARNEFICWVEDAKQAPTRAPHSPNAGGVRRRHAPAVLLARVQTSRANGAIAL